MQYKPETQKVAMMSNSYMPVLQPVSVATDSQVQRTRKIFMIIVGVCLALSMVTLVGAIFGSGIANYTESIILRGIELGEAITAILFYGFGLFVAHRYSETGLRVFAWLGVVTLVTEGIGYVLVLIFIIIPSTTTISSGSDEIMGATSGVLLAVFVIAGICLTIGFIVVAVLVKLAFKLTRLIDANKRISTQQI